MTPKAVSGQLVGAGGGSVGAAKDKDGLNGKRLGAKVHQRPHVSDCASHPKS